MRCTALLTIPLIATTLIPASTTTAWAQRNWVELGCRVVNWAIDRDTIPVGRRDGRFTAIRLRVSGNDVRIFDLSVVYGNGKRDDIPVRAVIRDGGRSGPLDLRGGDRAIDRIQMIYEARKDFRGRAEVCVDGRMA